MHRLRRVKLTICGVGGLGEAFASEAFLRGFRNFTLVDADRVRRKNLRRAIWYGRAHVGMRKVDSLAAEILSRDQSAVVEVIPSRSLSRPAIAAARSSDVVVAAFDNNFSRYHLQSELIEPRVPLLDLGAQENFDGRRFIGGSGQLRLSVPDGPCLLCMGLVTAGMRDPKEIPARRRAGYLDGTTFTPRRVRGVNAFLAVAAADLLADWIMARPSPRFLAWDGAQRRFREIAFDRPTADCPLCCRIASIPSLDATDLASLRKRARVRSF